MKNTLSILSVCLLAAGAAQAAIINFADLNTALTGNSLTAGGATTGVAVTGAADGNNYIYSVTYTGADYDGDLSNDTLTFDVLVEAWSGGTTITTVGGSNDTTGDVAYGATATIGTTDVQAFIGGEGWGAGVGSMPVNSTLEFTIQNYSLTLTDITKSGSAVASGFVGGFLDEIGSGYGHITVIGEGTGLKEIGWNLITHNLAAFDTDSDNLYLTSGNPSGASLRPQNWLVQDVDFGIDVTVIPEPATLGLVASCAFGVLFIRRRFMM